MLLSGTVGTAGKSREDETEDGGGMRSTWRRDRNEDAHDHKDDPQDGRNEKVGGGLKFAVGFDGNKNGSPPFTDDHLVWSPTSQFDQGNEPKRGAIHAQRRLPASCEQLVGWTEH